MPMLDYQLNRGCLSDLFDIKDTSGLLCSCPEKDDGNPIVNADSEHFAAGFIFYTDSLDFSHSDTADDAAANDSSLLDLETHAVFLPLIQPVLMQRFPRKLSPASELIMHYPQSRPGNIIIPPQMTTG